VLLLPSTKHRVSFLTKKLRRAGSVLVFWVSAASLVCHCAVFAVPIVSETRPKKKAGISNGAASELAVFSVSARNEPLAHLLARCGIASAIADPGVGWNIVAHFARVEALASLPSNKGTGYGRLSVRRVV